jgi:CelD/BcsL family acetyltransferase involved in cellulose biosynthesis
MTVSRAALVLEPIDVLADARDDWRRLALASRNIFASWEWHDVWWRHFGRGRKLDAAICRTEDGRALIVLPVYRWLERPLRVARFLGHTTGDELGPIYASGHRGAVAAALTRYAVERQIQLVVAEHVPDAGSWKLELNARVLARSPSPSLELPFESWAGFLATRSANRRADVRRKERRLERDHAVTYRLTQTADELKRDLDTLFALHAARWGGETSFLRAEAFHREFAAIAFERSWLRLWTLEVDGHARAAWYGFRYAGVESYYQSGRDVSAEFSRYGLGLIVLSHSIRAALEDGMTEYRFLRGGERYKYHFTDSDRLVETFALPRCFVARGALGVAVGAWRLPLVRNLAARL